MGRIAVLTLAFGLWIAAGNGSFIKAETPSARPPWHYQLIEGSTLVVDCPVCAGPTLIQPLRGSFKVRLLEENPILSRYALEEIDWTTSYGLPNEDRLTGSGTWEIGGEVALLQTMTLDLTVNGEAVHMTNTSRLVPRSWPMIEIPLQQDPASAIRVLLIQLNAAPFRELWFSTASGFTPVDPNRPRGSSGDLLSSIGRVVRSNRDLTAAFQFDPVMEDYPLDAFDVAPGGQVLFSLNETTFSQNLGAIQHGDLVGERGERLYLNQQLLEPFGLIFNAIDLGLDALAVQDDGEVLFSLTTNMTSPNAGPLDRGDLLSNRGFIVRTHAQLLSRFHPQGKPDFGLDAVFQWPHGEVWFSTEDGFIDNTLGYIQAGDLLSDQGYVVIHNLDLMAPFQPVEDLADFGLDGLFVVTDFVPPRERPQLTLRNEDDEGAAWRLEWRGQGRVFQVEMANPIGLEWIIDSPIVPGASRLFPSPAAPAALYRLRQW